VPTQLSIVVPLFDEADNVQRLASEIHAAFRPEPVEYEIVLVDDGSRDRTWDAILRARQGDPRVRGLRLSRQSGQSAALWTGLQAARGSILATLDGDLQNDPADLPRLLRELPGYDLVQGVRARRQDTWLRRVSSRFAARARRIALGARFRDTGCAVRVFPRSTLSLVFGFNGLHRFFPILVQGGGGQVRESMVNHRPRVAGRSKYGVWNRLGRGLFDLVAMAWYKRRRFPKVAVTEADSGA